MIRIKIKEDANVAKLAAKYMRANSLAIVFGSTVYLCNITKQQFLKDKRLFRHEVEHVIQYRRHGFLKFLFLYCRESYRKGYYENKFEKEARASENDITLLDDVLVC